MDQQPNEDPTLPATPSSYVPAPPPPPPIVQPLPPPVGPPASATAARTGAESLAERARFAQGAIWLNLAATVLAFVSLVRDRSLLVDIRDGEFVSNERIDAVDRFAVIVGVIYLLTFLLAAIAFVRWFAQAYRNLASWTLVKHKTGWAIGAWFVPFLNVWRPFKIAEEIAVGSSDPRADRRPRIITVWWTAFMASNLISRALFRQDPQTIDAFITNNVFGFVGEGFWLIAGIAVIMIMRRVTDEQDQRILAARSAT